MPECYKCFYRSRVTLSCDYILVERKRRGTSVKDCDKFKPRLSGDLDENLLKMERLYYKGYSDRKIARELNISRYKVYVWRTSRGLETNGESQRGRPRKE